MSAQSFRHSAATNGSHVNGNGLYSVNGEYASQQNNLDPTTTFLKGPDAEFSTWCAIRNSSIGQDESLALRGLMFRHYGFIATTQAWKYSSRKMPYASLLDSDDLHAYANLGLWDATGRYDPFMGNTFHTYAFIKVNGAIKDGLRNLQDFSRSIARVKRELEPLVNNLTQELGHKPTLEELSARYIGRFIGNYVAFDDVMKDPLIFASVFNQGDNDKEDYEVDSVSALELSLLQRNQNIQFTPFDQLQRVDLIDKVLRILKRDEIEQSVIYSYYFVGMNSNEISNIYRISMTLISEKKTSALMKLRKAARGDENFAEQLRSFKSV